jgi:inorganic triphosphatase YgiF
MTETKREIERKYEGPLEGSGLPDVTGVPGVASVVDKGLVELDAVYYDTVGHRLADDRIILRRRTGGSDEGWHLKFPVPLEEGVRDEIQAPLDEGREDSAERQGPQDPRGSGEPQGPEGAPGAGDTQGSGSPQALPALFSRPPAALTGLVRSRVRDAPLVPVVRLHSARHLSHLVDAAGELLAEVSIDRVRAERLSVPDGSGVPDDSGVPDGPGPRDVTGIPVASGATAEWTEAEVELADGGSPDFLDQVESELRKAGWRASSSPSKLARALEETAPETPAATRPNTAGGSTPDRRTPSDSAAAPVLAYLRAQRDALIELDPAVRRDLPDSVHRMRVATRRLRSALRSFRKVLDRTVTDPIAGELKWLAGELGVDRDREVLTERLSAGLDGLPSELVSGPVRERLANWSEGRHGGFRRRVLDVLDGERYLTLLATLDGLLAGPPLRKAAAGKPEPVLRKALRRDGRRLSRLFDEALREPPGDAR